MKRSITALVISLMLIGCASAPKAKSVCVTNECGVTCCNDDGKVCPPCKRDR